MDAQLMEALGDILADALLADLETEMEEEHALAVASAESPRGIGSQTDARRYIDPAPHAVVAP
jgi:hypothetical protein